MSGYQVYSFLELTINTIYSKQNKKAPDLKYVIEWFVVFRVVVFHSIAFFLTAVSHILQMCLHVDVFLSVGMGVSCRYCHVFKLTLGVCVIFCGKYVSLMSDDIPRIGTVRFICPMVTCPYAKA